MLKLLQSPAVHQSLRVSEQVINWDALNEIERECGMPLTPCPESDVTQRLGLKDDRSAGR
jgi:hypothetical protein